MKEKTSKLMQKMHLAKAKLGILAATAMTATPTMAQAATKGQATNLIFDIVDKVVSIFPFIGIFFIVAGGFKLIMAYRNDQPEAQAGAAKDIVIGVVFVAFKVFFWTFDNQIRAMLGNVS